MKKQGTNQGLHKSEDTTAIIYGHDDVHVLSIPIRYVLEDSCLHLVESVRVTGRTIVPCYGPIARPHVLEGESGKLGQVLLQVLGKSLARHVTNALGLGLRDTSRQGKPTELP